MVQVQTLLSCVEQMTDTKTENTIKIQEVVRNTAAGRFSYAIYKGKVARRAFRRGRPHYDLVASITLGNGDKPVTKEVSVDSQLGRILLA